VFLFFLYSVVSFTMSSTLEENTSLVLDTTSGVSVICDDIHTTSGVSVIRDDIHTIKVESEDNATTDMYVDKNDTTNFETNNSTDIVDPQEIEMVDSSDFMTMNKLSFEWTRKNNQEKLPLYLTYLSTEDYQTFAKFCKTKNILEENIYHCLTALVCGVYRFKFLFSSVHGGVLNVAVYETRKDILSILLSHIPYLVALFGLRLDRVFENESGTVSDTQAKLASKLWATSTLSQAQDMCRLVTRTKQLRDASTFYSDTFTTTQLLRELYGPVKKSANIMDKMHGLFDEISYTFFGPQVSILEKPLCRVV